MSPIILVLVSIFIISLFAVLLSRRIKLINKFKQNKESYLQQINLFFEEYSELTKNVVSEESEKNFIEKWKSFYKEIIKYPVPKKNDAYSEIERFRQTYTDLHNLISKSNAEIERKKKVSVCAQKVNTFFERLSELTGAYVTHAQEERFIGEWKELSDEAKYINVITTDEEYNKIERFNILFPSLHNHFEIANEQFISKQSEKYDSLLSNIDGKSLDAQQRAAVITDEDRILVLAGAGSGKTLTISAKVKYLCDVKHINPKDILLISFTKKSAQEMTDRIQKKLGIDTEATTFHKLGLGIISSASGKRPDVVDEDVLNQFIHNFFENEVVKYPDLVKALTEYFTYFLEIPDDMENYASLGELYEEEKSADLETLKSKYDREKFIKNAGIEKSKLLKTLNNEVVKSIEETKIANFLFMHGIKYEYERLYPFESEDIQKKAYRPDFYLTDYDLYLEHFGISKEFTVPWLSPVEEQKYLEGIKWKRAFHEEHGTTLLETYSYYSSEGILLKKLEEILLKNNVELKSPDFTDIFNTVYSTKSNKYFSEFMKLCCTFITLFKSNNYKIEQIEELRQNYLEGETNDFLRERTCLFLDIIKSLLTEYQAYLDQNNAIDFSDMINNAADMINGGCIIPSYRYVIVDEYQDISKSRFSFLKAIADRTGAKFFCVGDDWQSIYRFAGSDISLFTDFEKYFGYTKILKIEKTYRNSQQLIDEASRFILQNPMQLKKNLLSDKNLKYPLVFWGYDKDAKKALQQCINKIISEFGVSSSILMLGRTNYDIEIAKETGLFRPVFRNRKQELEYIPSPSLKIEFMSVHKSKGLEADNVIILNFINDKLGFPNQIADDKVLNLVLTNAEDYRFAEERRLFYVAITRTKNRTFVLTDNRNPSIFFREFNASDSVCFVFIKDTSSDEQTKCPHCKTGNLLKVEYDGGYFIGCSNFPRCKYTIHDASVLVNPKRCPSCGGFLVIRKGKNGHRFSGCTNYPYCQYTEEIHLSP